MSEKPVVGIIMGSRSDWPTLKAAAAVLAVTREGSAGHAERGAVLERRGQPPGAPVEPHVHPAAAPVQPELQRAPGRRQVRSMIRCEAVIISVELQIQLGYTFAIYGFGGLIVPFIGIKLIDLIITALHVA